MKKNRLPVYLFLFFIALIAFSMYGRSEIKDFPEGKVTSYQHSMKASMMDILKHIPIEQIEKEKVMSKDQSVIFLEKTDRILSSYTELREISSIYLNTDESNLNTQSILENLYVSFSQLEEDKTSTIKLTDGQAGYISDVYRFFSDVHHTDILNMELDESLEEMNKVAEKYPNLSRRMEGLK